MTVVPNITGLEVANCLHQVLPGLCHKDVSLVIDAYSEHWRTYHNLNHIWGMIGSAKTQFHSLCTNEEWRVLQIMVLYHDVVYKVGDAGKDNERASADFMADMLSTLNEPKWFESCAWAGIYATKSHSLEGVPPQYRKTTSMLIDLDLRGLGLPEEGFAKNTEAIWQEYQPIATRQQYDQGRALWAKSFMARAYIFQTELFRDLYEAQARRNLAQLQA